MRGKGFDVFCNGFPDRITPAYAGKSAFFTPLLCQLSGSPPPMRGKGRSRFRLLSNSRITPAYAGKSQRRPPAEYPDRDHPRLCGEKHMEVYAICDIIGSPPPMRGKAAFVAFNIVTIRITPAYAGKSNPEMM